MTSIQNDICITTSIFNNCSLIPEYIRREIYLIKEILDLLNEERIEKSREPIDYYFTGSIALCCYACMLGFNEFPKFDFSDFPEYSDFPEDFVRNIKDIDLCFNFKYFDIVQIALMDIGYNYKERPIGSIENMKAIELAKYDRPGFRSKINGKNYPVIDIFNTEIERGGLTPSLLNKDKVIYCYNKEDSFPVLSIELLLSYKLKAFEDYKEPKNIYDVMFLNELYFIYREEIDPSLPSLEFVFPAGDVQNIIKSPKKVRKFYDEKEDEDLVKNTKITYDQDENKIFKNIMDRLQKEQDDEYDLENISDVPRNINFDDDF